MSTEDACKAKKNLLTNGKEFVKMYKSSQDG